MQVMIKKDANAVSTVLIYIKITQPRRNLQIAFTYLVVSASYSDDAEV